MRVLKTLLSVLIFSILGIALGTGIFYLQQYLATHKTTTASAQTTTAKATPSPAPSSSYTSEDGGISYTLPTNTVVLENELADLGTLITGATENLYVSDVAKNSVTDTGVQITTLSTTGTTTAFTAAITKLEHPRIAGRLLSQTLETTTDSGLTVTKKSYLGTVGGSDVLATITTDTFYTMVYIPSTTTLSEESVNSLLKSIKKTDKNPVASASPSALLNSTNE